MVILMSLRSLTLEKKQPAGDVMLHLKTHHTEENCTA